MVAVREIRHRAVMMGIETGEMPDVDLIWARQVLQGTSPCFGQGAECRRYECPLRSRCLALEFFAARRSAIKGSPVENRRRYGESGVGEFDPFVGRESASAGTLGQATTASGVA
jgi:hypothetical protein